jgi:predicted TIM-barrel fold metal-dependent hydrolase
MVTDNDFVAGLAAAGGKCLFGASVHPYRRDALVELERLIELGACLVKWLPSAQNIQPDHSRCFLFYDLLARHKVPLLSHTGGEHTLKTFPNSLSDPRRLVPALERGVTVIAAHCGTSLFLHEKSYFRAWQEMALRHENFYGDISAFGVITRIWRLGALLRSPQLAAKCVFGSDFPVPPWPLSCLGKISVKKALEIRRTRNYFNQSVALMKAAGVTDEIFARGGRLLRLPDAQRTPTPLPMGKVLA